MYTEIGEMEDYWILPLGNPIPWNILSTVTVYRVVIDNQDWSFTTSFIKEP